MREPLSRGAGRPVVDKTGLKGTFSLFLYYAPPGGNASASSIPDLFTAVEQELGLKLRAGKEEMPAIVVDHLERAPTEN